MKEGRPSNDLRTFSLNDRLNSNQNLRYERSNRDNRWIRDYVIPYTNNDISDPKIYAQNKRESPNTEESLEELKRTVLELKENLTRRNENSERNKAIEKAILNNKENEKLSEENPLKRISKNKRKKDPSFLQSKGQKHTERSSAAALVRGNVNNAKLSWLNEAESPEEMIESDKSLNNVGNQDRSVILLRNKRTNLRNDPFNGREMNLYKQLTNVDDLIAQQAKLLDYDNTNNNNNNKNKNVLSETEQNSTKLRGRKFGRRFSYQRRKSFEKE
ncbi:serine/threonine-protein kinase pakE-like [Polistes fuscatus]|uniref:serine/threonine-protein kinase pakE-like n=1 Tax=Polistes fuscatus TaxID=30207 RepID=UPI001CA7FF14|nr:serine/threonine-protein kinase pakE-like [Polistes fuscatus]